MGLTQIGGLPAHVLLVHAVVVLVPLTVIVMIACAVWPPLMRRLGIGLPVLALVTLGFVPVTTHAGEWLEKRVEDDALVHKHTELGDSMLPWAIAVFVLATAVWWTYRRYTPSTPDASSEPTGGTSEEPSAGRTGTAPTVRTPLRIAAAVLTLAIGAGTIVQIYRIGESGAKAAWTGQYTATAHHSDGDDG